MGEQERLFTVSVAGAEQYSPWLVVDGESEHAVELGEAVLAPNAISLQQHFGVAARAERGAQGPNSPLKKALLTGFHSTAKHNATKAVSPSSETMRTI